MRLLPPWPRPRRALLPPRRASADLQSLIGRAVSLHQAGDLEGAVQAYEEAIRLGADGPAVRSNLGAALAGLGRVDEAVEQLRRALAVDPANTAIRRNLALAYYKAGRVAEAAGEAEVVLGAQPESEAARLLLADCLFRLGQNAGVVELLRPSRGGRPPSARRPTSSAWPSSPRAAWPRPRRPRPGAAATTRRRPTSPGHDVHKRQGLPAGPARDRAGPREVNPQAAPRELRRPGSA